MKNYTLEEIKEELNKEISELEKIDSFWLKCKACPFKGKCCIDNDIDIREDEWKLIQDLLDTNHFVFEQVKDNFENHKKCYFRIDTCCLIHNIRPTNCIYTPYQAIITDYENLLIYNKCDDLCNFTTIESKDEIKYINPYLIEIKNSNHKYLLLNYWVSNFEKQTIDSYKMLGEDRLREYFENRCKKV